MDGLASMLGGLFGDGGSALPSFTTNAGLQDTIGSQAGDMTQLLGRGIDGGGMGGLAGMLKDFDLTDVMKGYFGYQGMQEQKKNNKLNRKLTTQNINENDRITKGKEDVGDIFNTPSSGLASYGSSTVG